MIDTNSHEPTTLMAGYLSVLPSEQSIKAHLSSMQILNYGYPQHDVGHVIDFRGLVESPLGSVHHVF